MSNTSANRAPPFSAVTRNLTCTMKKASQYRQHAEECRVLARGADSENLREQLLIMAETWERLAREREELVIKHPELAKLDPPVNEIN